MISPAADVFLSHVALIIPTLCGGGAEHVMARMANWWAARGTRSTLITFDAQPAAYPLHPAVRRLALDEISPVPDLPQAAIWPAEAANIARLRAALRHCLEHSAHRPLAVISFLSRMNLRTLLACQNLPCRMIVCERAHAPACPLPEEEEKLRRLLYPLAERVVFQTAATCRWGQSFLEEERCAVIPNSVAPEPGDILANFPGLSVRKPFFLAAGRLEPQKGFELLLEAFAPLAAQFPALSLIIAGDGSLRTRLEEQIQALKLEKRVMLPGFITQLPSLMQRALAFVLSSKFEGFPNVLLESLAHACPAIAFDCPTGPREIIRHGIDGLLVKAGDVRGLAAAMRRLLQEPELRSRLARAAPEVRRRFAEEQIMAQWQALFNSPLPDHIRTSA